jgi:hypothetical protein
MNSGATAPVWATAGGGGGLQSIQTFTSGSGTYTRPAGVTKALVYVTGGGGGGGAPGGGNGGGGGGGAGGTAIKWVTLGATESYTVGNGGAAGAYAGYSSSFGSHCTATAGNASGGPEQAQGDDNAGGAGGVGSSGDINIPGGGGGHGHSGSSNVYGHSGDGGNSFWGTSSRNVGYSAPASTSRSGISHGGGGEGGYHSGSAGAGGAGIVVVYEYA